MELADILSSLLSGQPSPSGIAGLMNVGDVIDARRRFGQQVQQGENLARPIMPPMGAVPPGGGGQVVPFTGRQGFEDPMAMKAYGNTRDEALYNRALETQNINRMWQSMPVTKEDQFTKSFMDRLSWYPPFQELPSATVKDTIKRFYLNPTQTLGEIKDAIGSLSKSGSQGSYRKELLQLHQMLEEETNQ